MLFWLRPHITPIATLFKINSKPCFSVVLLPVLFTLQSVVARAQNFNATLIPDSLKENASVVIRLDQTEWDIKSASSLTYHRRVVYTILNEKGEDYAGYYAEYNDRSIKINSINGYLFDASGKEIAHFKKKDMADHPYGESAGFVNDERYKYYGFNHSSYPYTVEFEEEKEMSDFISLPEWVPQKSSMTAVEMSSLKIITPKGYKLSYRMLHADIKPKISDEKGDRVSYQWEMGHITAVEIIPYEAAFATWVPRLIFSLGSIDVQGFKGDMTSWAEFGKFYASLQKGRDVLPNDVKQKVHQLTDGLNSPEAKVRVLYDYLQQNSHYVNISLGIGGWQCTDANYVAKNKYGDCKALSNFMVSLLKEAGIKAYPVVIEGSTDKDEDFDPGFSYDPFNHVICTVPMAGDTIWLECTDQFLPAGYLSEFTADRYGLMAKEDGGILIHTPAYGLRENTRIRRINANVDAEGNMMADISTVYQALCQDDIDELIHHQSKEEQRTNLKKRFSLPSYDVVSFNYQEDDSKRLPLITETLKLSVNAYAQMTGKRLFIDPNILSRFRTKLSEDKNRKIDIDLKDAWHYADSIEILLPPGYETESRPEDKEFKTKFGYYHSRVLISSGKIVYQRIMDQYQGRFPSADHGELVKYFNKVYDADHTLIVLVKKN